MVCRLTLHCRRNRLLDLAKDQLIQPLPNSAVGIRQDVSVAIHGCLDRGVTQLGLDELNVFPLGDEKGRVGVT